MSVKIYGASDDLIEMDGSLQGEWGVNCDTVNHVALSDGSMLKITYDSEGIWRIDCCKCGDAFGEIRVCEPADDEYSDVASFSDEIEWAIVGRLEGKARTIKVVNF